MDVNVDEIIDFSDIEVLELAKGLLLNFVPQLIISYDLEELFFVDKKIAIKKVLEIFKEEDPFENGGIVIEYNFEEDHKKLYEAVINNELVNEFPEMFLYKCVSLFEGMINHYLYMELTAKYSFSYNKINKILSKLSTADKIDWFMEIIIGKSWTNNSPWSEIKPYLNARNFLIHYKPSESKKHEEITGILNRERLIFLLEQSLNFFNILKDNISKERDIYNQKIERIREIILQSDTE